MVRRFLKLALALSLSLFCYGTAAPAKPQIYSLSPGTTDAGTFTISVKGAGFVAGSSVKLEGVASTTKFVSSTELAVTATVNANAAIPVTVGNPAPDAAASNVRTLTVVVPKPVIHWLTPSSVNIGSFTVTVNGDDFAAGAAVVLDGKAVPTKFISNKSLSFTTSVPNGHAAVISVRNPAPLAADSNEKTLTVVAPKPQIWSMTPSTVDVGSFTVTLSGAGFVPGSIVKVDTVAVPTKVVSDKEITFTTTVAKGHAAMVSVTNPNPNPAVSNEKTLNVVAPKPQIWSLTPSSVNVGTFTVTINGSGFVNGSVVTLDGATVPTKYVSASQLSLTATAPKAHAGLINVSNPEPNPAKSNDKTLNIISPRPGIASLTPSSVNVGTFTISVKGVNFLPGSVVKLDGAAVTTKVISDSELTFSATVPKGHAAEVVVANPEPNPDVSSTRTLNVVAPRPQISSLSPNAVNIGNFAVTVNGANFVQGATVLLDGAAVPTKFVSATQLTITSSSQTPHAATIVVSHPEPNVATSSERTLNIMPPITIDASNNSMVTMRAGATKKFYASVSNAADKSVTWSVNGIVGGNATLGTIAADGTYAAPPLPPTPNVLTLTVASVASPSVKDTVALTLNNPRPVLTSVTPSTLAISKAATFTINGTGFAPGAIVKRAGVPLTATIVSDKVINVTGEVPASVGSVTTLTVSNLDPGATTSAALIVPVSTPNAALSLLAAGRFLEQASWGPDPDSLAHVRQVGINAWITEQIATPPSLYKSYGTSGLDKNQSEFFTYAASGPDQLRQRVAFALSQIFVISGLKTPESRQFAPFLNLLSTQAFGNFRNLLRDVTLNPAMGIYLDMVNNDKADAVTGIEPNENYAREVLQLFTMGTAPLSNDGTQLPGNTYDQATVLNLSRAFTGWTFNSSRGAPARGHNNPNFEGPMLPVEANHDTGAKIIFGVTLPAGRTATQDLDAALDVIFQHQNVGPFICFRLIQHLVTSNPSGAYMQRVVAVFNNNGQNVRGDLAAVVRAILTDPEARAGDNAGAATPVTDGHLREPVLFLVNLLRALDATVIVQNPLESAGADMGQKLFYASSVFNYYSPLYRIPGNLYGPEFQLLSPATALARANVVYNLIVNGLDRDVRFSTEALAQIASADPARLVDVINDVLLYGRMPSAMRSEVVTAVLATNDRSERVKTALYLIASSPLYQVEH